jgi:hypothetical protein
MAAGEPGEAGSATSQPGSSASPPGSAGSCPRYAMASCPRRLLLTVPLALGSCAYHNNNQKLFVGDLLYLVSIHLGTFKNPFLQGISVSYCNPTSTAPRRAQTLLVLKFSPTKLENIREDALILWVHIHVIQRVYIVKKLDQNR